jgi:RimJ/RimL family protein N-acetyltransferase
VAGDLAAVADEQLTSGSNAMDTRLNAFGQPIGAPLPEWRPVPRPPREPIEGARCRVEPIDPGRHADDLHEAFGRDSEGRNFTYLGAGPFATRAEFDAWLKASCLGDDPMFHAIIDRNSRKAVGVASYMRIDPANGVIEVGHINFSPLLQRSTVATEAIFLMLRRAFDELGYRRFEWKCDSLNAPSRRAAARFGFTYEGLFRQAVVYRARSRDTTWFSIIDKEWPSIRSAYEVWLSPSNFDAQGRQKVALSTLMARLRGEAG